MPLIVSTGYSGILERQTAWADGAVGDTAELGNALCDGVNLFEDDLCDVVEDEMELVEVVALDVPVGELGL